MFPCILYFFIHPQPNNIDPARQQPRDWGSLLISLSLFGGGGGHSYYLLALRLLDYMGFAMEASTEWKMGGHTLKPHSLGTGDKCPPPPPPNTPQISDFFVWDYETAQKCFILGNQTTGDLKSHHLQAQVTLAALSVPPRSFSFSRAVMSYK